MFCHFIYMRSADPALRLDDAQIARIDAIVASIPDLARGLRYLPALARDYYTDDGASPQLALQLYYRSIEQAEAAMAGALTALNQSDLWGDLTPQFEHQLMVARGYPVDDATYQPDGQEPPCAYLVHYPGAAEDFNLWLDYYLDHHPQIMRTFARIREIEIYSRCDWRDGLGWDQAHYMQRNRLIFDSAAALEAALNSPIRHDMREDFLKFPPFSGSNIHYPMFKTEIAS